MCAPVDYLCCPTISVCINHLNPGSLMSRTRGCRLRPSLMAFANRCPGDRASFSKHGIVVSLMLQRSPRAGNLPRWLSTIRVSVSSAHTTWLELPFTLPHAAGVALTSENTHPKVEPFRTIVSSSPHQSPVLRRIFMKKDRQRRYRTVFTINTVSITGYLIQSILPDAPFPGF